jgi:hypothetical protein
MVLTSAAAIPSSVGTDGKSPRAGSRDDTIYVVVPHVAKEGELSDADLEKVAGGKQDITAHCSVSGGLASAANTVTLNLG